MMPTLSIFTAAPRRKIAPAISSTRARAHAFTPAPMAGAASRSSGQRGRTGASSGSIRPSARRSAPAQAIIAALSLHRLRRRHVEGEAARSRKLAQAFAQALVGGDAAGDDEARGARSAEPLGRDVHGARAAIGDGLGYGRLEARRRCRRHPASLQRRELLRRAAHGRLQAGEGEMRLLAPEHRPRQVEAARHRRCAPPARPPGRRESPAPAASPSCRRLRPARRRWSCRAARSRRRRARSGAACARPTRAAADRAGCRPSVSPTVSACASR